jgi:hypothetical protein
MPQTDTISYVAVAITVVLAFGMITAHFRIYRLVPSSRRLIYLMIFTGLFIGTLFVPLMDGGLKMGWIPLWTAYHILSLPEFYLSSNRDDFAIDCLIFGIPIVQHIVCFALSIISTKRQNNKGRLAGEELT